MDDKNSALTEVYTKAVVHHQKGNLKATKNLYKKILQVQFFLFKKREKIFFSFFLHMGRFCLFALRRKYFLGRLQYGADWAEFPANTADRSNSICAFKRHQNHEKRSDF